jgi:hypothetical protein
MADKAKPKRQPFKGETEDERQDSMVIYTTLDNVRTRFGQQMIPIELAILELLMDQQLHVKQEESEPPE